jgi:predicted CXXCH cytochrome family protein
MRRLGLLFAGGAIWLFLAAIPALADGGPHVSSINNGSLGINADSCAGCHRAHTAQGPMLLNVDDENGLCLACHGSAGVGATTDVMSGVQYKVALAPGSAGQDPTNASVLLGALRGGGFDEARIDAGDAYRYRYGDAEAAHPTVYSFDKRVGVGAAEPVTSAHLDLDGPGGVLLKNVAWGNGAFSATANAGPTVTLGCASCHNPHGNGQYRILNPIPSAATGTLVEVSPTATWNIKVTDAPNPTNATRNYTVIQYKGPTAAGRYLLASEIVADAVPPTAGDYWHQVVPYDARVTDSTNANHDAPNGIPSFFNGQMNAWCSTCHSRYTQSTNYTQTSGVPNPGTPSGTGAEAAGNLRTRVCQLQPDGTCSFTNTGQPMVTPSGDAIYDYRHTTSRNRACTTCHVAHGSNAEMTGTFSSTFPYPNDTAAAPSASASSRLLKIDDRGTCQLCHDPTMTVPVGNQVNGPAPALP